MGRHWFTGGVVAFTATVAVWSWSMTRTPAPQPGRGDDSGQRSLRTPDLEGRGAATKEPDPLLIYAPGAVYRPPQPSHPACPLPDLANGSRPGAHWTAPGICSPAVRSRFGYLARRDRVLLILPHNTDSKVAAAAEELSRRSGLAVMRGFPYAKDFVGDSRVFCLIGREQDWGETLRALRTVEPLPVPKRPRLIWVAALDEQFPAHVGRSDEPPGLFWLTGRNGNQVAQAVREVASWGSDIKPLGSLPDVIIVDPPGIGAVSAGISLPTRHAVPTLRYHSNSRSMGVVRFAVRLRRSSSVCLETRDTEDPQIWVTTDPAGGWARGCGGSGRIPSPPGKWTTIWVTGNWTGNSSVDLTTSEFRARLPVQPGDDLQSMVVWLDTGSPAEPEVLSSNAVVPISLDGIDSASAPAAEASAGAQVFWIDPSMVIQYRRDEEPRTRRPWSQYLRDEVASRYRKQGDRSAARYLLMTGRCAATSGFGERLAGESYLLIDLQTFHIYLPAQPTSALLPDHPLLVTASRAQLAEWAHSRRLGRTHLLWLQMEWRDPDLVEMITQQVSADSRP